ncbi:MAG: universal stress protein [Microthrixaceae bacterium]|nr:universal stress protein [Microthrixaceae bacterium]TXI41767.1 MAG: universal stress protein [Mycobacterium sp.]
MTEASSNTIHHAVVGFDGSENSTAALQWAFDHVRRLGGGDIKVVMAWNYAPTAVGGYGIGGSLPPAESMQEVTERALADALEGVTPPEGVTVTQVVREGPASKVLVEEAAGSEVLVVGKRGHGGFLGLLIGSITNQVANHASCPVVIVPAHPE